jgi:energy-coupling factor transport system permease protein
MSAAIINLTGNNNMKDDFSTYHPIINFLYFALVIVFSMFFMHPACLLISLLCAFIYSVYLNGKKAMRFNLLYMMPLLIITALINPVFNHAGVTILFYLKNGNPITLESIVYGVAEAIMFITIIIWFSCYNAVMTSDKFVYLFGKIIPAMSLILSMVLRLVPRFKAQIKVIANAQRCVGRDVSNGNILQRAHNGIRIISIMITWALESAIDTADSMKSRGYGLPGRTAFSIYHFSQRDGIALSIMLGLAAFILAGFMTGGISTAYFPTVRISAFTPFSLPLYISYAGLCLMPVIIDGWEDAKWMRIKSAA